MLIKNLIYIAISAHLLYLLSLNFQVFDSNILNAMLTTILSFRCYFSASGYLKRESYKYLVYALIGSSKSFAILTEKLEQQFLQVCCEVHSQSCSQFNTSRYKSGKKTQLSKKQNKLMEEMSKLQWTSRENRNSWMTRHLLTKYCQPGGDDAQFYDKLDQFCSQFVCHSWYSRKKNLSLFS